MNAREAAHIVAAIAAAFPQWPASKETVAIYADLLGDLDYHTVKAALRDLLLTEDRWPTVASIRRSVANRAGVLAPSAAQAWAEITRQADEVGRTGRPCWSHPAVAEAVKTIGWYDLCMSTNAETIRSQFMRIYEDSKGRYDRLLLSEQGRLSLDTGKANLDGSREIMATTIGTATSDRV